MTGPLLERDFKILLKQAVMSGRLYDTLRDGHIVRMRQEIDSLPKPHHLEDDDLKKTARAIAELADTTENSKSVRHNAKLKKDEDIGKLCYWLIEAYENSRAAAIRQAYVAARYVLADVAKEQQGIVEEKGHSEEPFINSSFRALSALITVLSDLPVDISTDENIGVINVFANSQATTLRDWEQALHAMFGVARRQSEEDPNHYAIVDQWESVLDRAPDTVSRDFVGYANRAVAKRPCVSTYLDDCVERAAQKFTL